MCPMLISRHIFEGRKFDYMHHFFHICKITHTTKYDLRSTGRPFYRIKCNNSECIIEKFIWINLFIMKFTFLFFSPCMNIVWFFIEQVFVRHLQNEWTLVNGFDNNTLYSQNKKLYQSLLSVCIAQRWIMWTAASRVDPTSKKNSLLFRISYREPLHNNKFYYSSSVNRTFINTLLIKIDRKWKKKKSAFYYQLFQNKFSFMKKQKRTRASQ